MGVRLPVPDWTRVGETWRIEEEPGWEPIDDGLCEARRCYRRAVVWRPRDAFALCAIHTRDTGRMWVENGRVVSWRLSK